MFVEKILKGVEKQKLFKEIDINDIAVSITLINDETFPFCFIFDEDDKYLSIFATDANGLEKIVILQKETIVTVRLVYSDDFNFEEEKKEEDKKDVMVI